jgi:dTMP kinase
MKYPVSFDIELKRNTYGGLYIALEGIDGSGKTTQAKELQKYFGNKGKKVFVTHEPRRDGALGPLIHDVLQGKVKIPPIANQYLFAAQRVVHIEEMVIPALSRGEIVISDRCFWFSVPYGLFDREKTEGKPEDTLLTALSLLSLYHEFVTPDFTFFLDVAVETAAKRLSGLTRKAEIYEKGEKLQKIKEGYDFIFQKFPSELIKVHAERHIDTVTKEIISLTEKK